MATLLQRLSDILQRDGDDDIDEDKDAFLGHVKSNLLDEDASQDHLPVPVYYYIKLKTNVQFLLHITLYMWWFATDIDLTIHTTVHE